MGLLARLTRFGARVLINPSDNIIGKVGIDQTTPGATNGVVVNDVAERTITHVCGVAASSGDNELVAAPDEGQRIVVVGFVIQNESAVPTTMILEDGTTDVYRCLGQNQGDGLAQRFSRGDEWRLTEAAALQMNLSGENSCGYSIDYFTEAV